MAIDLLKRTLMGTCACNRIWNCEEHFSLFKSAVRRLILNCVEIVAYISCNFDSIGKDTNKVNMHLKFKGILTVIS